MFAWPESNKSFWKEDCLPYSPGSMVDLSTRMLGVRLVLHNQEGNYQGVARVLKYEGHMLIYDPQTNGVGWVAMKGIPSSLTEVEVQSTGDLENFYPMPVRSAGRSKGHPVTPRKAYCRVWTVENRNTETHGRRLRWIHWLGHRQCAGQIKHTKPFHGYWRTHAG